MFEVTTYDVNGQEIDSAEVEPEGAHACAKQLWLDSLDGGTGVMRALVKDGERVVRVYLHLPE